MWPSVRGLTFTPFLNILHPTRRQLIFHSLSWLPTNFLGVMFPGLKERCNTVQLGEGACCTDTGHFSTALQAGLQGRRKCLVSPPTASEMVSAPGGPVLSVSSSCHKHLLPTGQIVPCRRHLRLSSDGLGGWFHREGKEHHVQAWFRC